MRLSRPCYRRIGPLCAHPRAKADPGGRSRAQLPAIEKDQMVWVWIGDPAKADATKIADYPYHNDPGKWPNKHDVYPIRPTTC
jgi:phenylpropionate dioxygenase-like ring-hydroxylating dioxygenase large terminal subunit